VISDAPPLALTFDDVLLQPAYSDFVPSDADVGNGPHARAPAEHPVPIERDGHGDRVADGGDDGARSGMGVLHKNFSPEEQAREVQKVKRAESGMVLDPVTVRRTTRFERVSR